MEATVGHIQFNVRGENLPFYRGLLGFLGWNTLYDVPEMLGVGGAHGQSLWFGGRVKEVENDYDGPGMNHMAFSATSVAEVDAAAAYLMEQGVPLLFETPRHRPEFSGDEQSTYYQIMFETPDRILIEVVYIGPK